MTSRPQHASGTSLAAEGGPLVARCILGGSLMFAADNAITLTVIRHYGHDVAEDINFRVLRSHQGHLFKQGLTKLGLDDEPSDALKCAKYHALSNVLGGLPVRYADGPDGRAWLAYDTPYCVDSPWTPSIAVAALRPEWMHKTMAAWHANNGVELGNAGLAFVITRLIAEGAPYDLGYFVDTGLALQDDERLQIDLEAQLPDDLELVTPAFDEETWPLARQAKAWRNFSSAYVGGRTYWLAEALGRDRAAAVLAQSFTVTLLQNRLRLEAALAEGCTSELEAAVAIWSGAHRSWGDEIETAEDGQSTIATVVRSRLHEVGEYAPPAEPFPAEFEAGIAEAWKTMLTYAYPSVSIDVDGAHGTDPGWTFRFSTLP